jgi:putative transcriptional regulator
MSRLSEVLYETADGLYKIGLMNDETMKEFECLRLPKIKVYTPAQIKRIRLKNKASQAALAAYLNISPSTVQKWEQGQKKPNGLALRVLNLIDHKGLSILAA